MRRDGERERRATALLANLPGMAYRVEANPPWRLTYVSEGVAELIGVSAAELLREPSTWSALVHPDDGAALEQEAESALQQRRGFSLVHRVRDASGNERWVLDRAGLACTSDGAPVAFEGFASDVTDLRRGEELLRQSEAKFRGSFESAAIGLAHVRLADGRFERVNDRLCELFGYSRAELQALSFQEVTHPDDLWQDLAKLHHLVAGEIESYTLEKRYLRKDGSLFWANLTATVFRGLQGEPEYGIAVVEDITERKLSEAALREQEERLRLAQAAGGVGVLEWNLSTQELRWSDCLFHVFGRTPRPDGKVSLDEVLTWLHPDDRERVLAETEAALERGLEPLVSEYRVVGEDGEIRWLYSRGESRRDAAGNPVSVLGAIQDVTTRKRAEEQRARAHERLSLAQRAGHAGLWDWDIQAPEETFVSPEYRDLYGLSDDEPYGYDRWLELIHEQDRERVEAYGREVFAHGSDYAIEFRFEHPSRGLRWLRTTGVIHRGAEGKPRRFSGVTIDITAMKRTEQALRQSEERLRKVIDSMFAFVGVLAPDGTLTEANQAPVEALGSTREELLGRKFWDCPWWNYDDAVRSRLQAAFRRAVSGEVVRYDETIRVADDGRMTIDFMLQPVFDDGRLQLLIPSAVDVTDRQRAEEALRLADRRKDEFLATLAHELRNLLAPLRTGLDVLQRASEAAIREQVEAMMGRQLGHMVRLIDDLLDVSRIAQGKVELQRKCVPLQMVVEHAVETSRPLIDAAGHTLATQLADEPIYVDGDLNRLAQVVSNLLNNAAKYTPRGGRIDLALYFDDGQATIRVADDGVGIPARMLPSVFDLFAQVSPDALHGQGGLGVGLSLVRGLVEMHGGTIEAESAGLGEGSTFTVRLPLAPRSSGEEPRVEEKAAPVTAPRQRVLVVDDNQDAANTLATVLTLDGYDTKTASDGPSALDAAREFCPGVIFLDIGLPGMSGYAVAERLRADPAFAGTLLVALTGWGGEEDRRRIREAGFDIHLTKPVDLEAVEDILARGA